MKCSHDSVWFSFVTLKKRCFFALRMKQLFLVCWLEKRDLGVWLLRLQLWKLLILPWVPCSPGLGDLMSLKSAELLKKAALQNRGKVGSMTLRLCSVMRTFEMPSMGDFTASWVILSFCRFYLNGSSSAQCTEEGKWNVDLPVCTRESVGPQFWGERLVVSPGSLLVSTLYIPWPGNPSVLTPWDGCSSLCKCSTRYHLTLEDATTLLEGQKGSIRLWSHLYPPPGETSDTWAYSFPHSHSFWQGLGYVWYWSTWDSHHLTRRTGNNLSATLGPHSFIYTFIHLCI